MYFKIIHASLSIESYLATHLCNGMPKSQRVPNSRQGPDTVWCTFAKLGPSSAEKITDGICQGVCLSNLDLFVSFLLLQNFLTHYCDKETSVKRSSQPVCS